MFREYDKHIKELLLSKNRTDWGKIADRHLIMILRIQHERLVHLLVTLFVGIIMTISAFVTIIGQNQLFVIFTIPLIILFGAYLFHYRFLENMTQNWYKIEEEIIANI
jgi:hypothetical protein